MRMSKKMASIVIASALALVLIVSGGTYAYFSDTVASEGNTFTTGTLTMDSVRDDLPITGPMFYTNITSDGLKGTGYWEPGKRLVRTLIVTNTGSLPAQLNHIQAQLINANGATDAEKAMFLRDMKIQTRYAVNAMRNNYTWLDIDVFLQGLEEAQVRFEAALDGELQGAEESVILDKMDQIYDEELDKLSIRDRDHIIHGDQPLSSYINGYDYEDINHHSTLGVPVLQPGDTMAIVYSAALYNNGNQNLIQGKEFNFDFTHEFVQVDPAPVVTPQ